MFFNSSKNEIPRSFNILQTFRMFRRIQLHPAERPSKDPKMAMPNMQKFIIQIRNRQHNVINNNITTEASIKKETNKIR